MEGCCRGRATRCPPGMTVQGDDCGYPVGPEGPTSCPPGTVGTVVSDEEGGGVVGVGCTAIVDTSHTETTHGQAAIESNEPHAGQARPALSAARTSTTSSPTAEEVAPVPSGQREAGPAVPDRPENAMCRAANVAACARLCEAGNATACINACQLGNTAACARVCAAGNAEVCNEACSRGDAAACIASARMASRGPVRDWIRAAQLYEQACNGQTASEICVRTRRERTRANREAQRQEAAEDRDERRQEAAEAREARRQQALAEERPARQRVPSANRVARDLAACDAYVSGVRRRRVQGIRLQRTGSPRFEEFAENFRTWLQEQQDGAFGAAMTDLREILEATGSDDGEEVNPSITAFRARLVRQINARCRP